MFQRLISYWVYGCGLSGVLLFSLSPILLKSWSTALAAIFLLLPAYMVHQYEEHESDRFRFFFNQTIGHGFDVLSPLAVFITNVPIVWGLISLSFCGAVLLELGWGLIAAYLVLINACVHIVHALVYKRYNPGLGTAVVIFLPLGGFTVSTIHHSESGQLIHHFIGLITAIFLHVIIIMHVRKKLSKAMAGTP